MGGILPTVRQQKSSKSGRIAGMIKDHIAQHRYTSEEKVTMFETEARQLFHVIITTGRETDPSIFSTYLSRFLYVAGRLRKARISMQAPRSAGMNITF